MSEGEHEFPENGITDKKKRWNKGDEKNDAPKKMKLERVQGRKDQNVHRGSKATNEDKPVLKAIKKRSSELKDKPDWKKIKKRSSELRKKRKETKYNYDLVVKAKILWEEMRRETCSAERRTELVTALYKLVKDHTKKMVFAHDTSRIIQWLLKLGTDEIRTSVIEGLKPSIIFMVQRRYSAICVKRMLKYGSNKCRTLIIHELQEHVVRLMSHAIASSIIEYAYDNWAGPYEKMIFQCKFSGEYYKMVLESGRKVRSIRDIIAISPEVERNVLDTVGNTLRHILNKGVLLSRLVQAVAIEYLTVCPESDKDEIYALLRPYILDIIRFREGVRLAIMCCWRSVAKEKKRFMAGLKGQVVQTALMEHGHLFLLALLDSVDDTVALKKYVLNELTKEVLTVAASEYGRRVVLYTVVHRDTLYFHPRIINMLKGGDMSQTLKKPKSIRCREIQLAVLPSYLESVESHVSLWFLNGSMAMVALAFLRDGSGDQWLKALKAVVKYMCEDHVVLEDDKEYALIEHSGCHLVFKKLIQSDNKDFSCTETFSWNLAMQLNEEIILKWVEHNRACFLLNLLFESGIEEAVQVLREKCTETIVEKLLRQTSVGAKILLKHIRGE